MISANRFTSDAKQIKYEVLRNVAALCFDGMFEEKKDDIPFELIQGTTPHFRCCVYKEREIIRGRVKLANGESPQPGKEPHLVNVISAACEGCPINRFRVTENCQHCMAKHCVSACPFNAISVTSKGAYIDTDKCRECGRCAKVCPYNAIADLMRPCKRSCPVDAITMDSHKIASIQEDKCIGCGACTKECPFGAISDISFMTKVIDALKSNKKVYAVFAPAIEGQFGADVTIGKIKPALKKLGFDECYEVALGADAVADNEGKELKEALETGRKMTTSCCPAFVNMIEKHFPDLVSCMSETVSPMEAISRYIKLHDPKAVVVFIGPCIAKKGEAMRSYSTVDYVLTFEELLAMFDSQDITFDEDCEQEHDGSIYGRKFAQSGGVSGAVMRSFEENDVELSVACNRCNGAAECKKTLTLLKMGKLTEDFVEGMCCVEGCMAGPAAIAPATAVKAARAKLLMQEKDSSINEKLEKFDFTGVKMTR